MLVLTRKAGEGIVLDNEIIIKVIEIKNGNIRLGIDAPESCKIYRQEIYERISSANKNAALWQPEDFDSLQVQTKRKKQV